MRGPLAALVLGAVVLAVIPVGATAAPTPFSLTFEGAHVADATLPAGLRHDGRFTASAPFCSAGASYDVRHFEGDPLSVLRLHTCDDGSGSFTALMPTVRSEHGGGGTWRIVAGTGRYAALRGLGTYTGTLVSGDPEVYDTITYRTSWRGIVDFDADPPAVDTFTATARKLPQRLRTYVVRVGVALRDTAVPLSYAVDVRAGGVVLTSKQGTTASGQVTLALRTRVPRGARSVRIVLVTQDAVGNAATARRSVGLQ